MTAGDDVILSLAESHDSFYLYDEDAIAQRAAMLKAAFPGVGLLYSVKCNHNPHVVKCVLGQGFGVDASSLGEVQIASNAGLGPGMVYYSAPGKSERDIRGSWGKASIIADSLDEILLIERTAAEKGEIAEIGVRLNPSFSFSGGEAVPSKFGVDEDQFFGFLAKGACPHVRVVGIHTHLRSQELSASVLSRYYGNVLDLAGRVEEAGAVLGYVNLGSGIGIPYAETDGEVDLRLLADALGGCATGASFRILIETGRYVVGKAGMYVAKVMDRKVSCGKTFVILKNTLNGFMRPSLARLAESAAPSAEPPACEPLYTGRGSFPIRVLNGVADTEKVTLVGNLCTSADVVAENVVLPRMERGDVVVFENAGAYAAVLSPMQFSSQEPPAELFLRSDGAVVR